MFYYLAPLLAARIFEPFSHQKRKKATCLANLQIHSIECCGHIWLGNWSLSKNPFASFNTECIGSKFSFCLMHVPVLLFF